MPLRTAVVVLAVVITSLAVGYLALRADRPGPDPGRAPGLRGNLLPRELTTEPTATFRLRDAQGGYLDTRSIAGRPFAVTFLYTQCPDVCPIIGQEIRQALDQLGAKSGAVSVLAVSVDPRGDTPDAVRRWLARQRMPANFRYLIGTQRRLAPVWKQFYAEPQVAGRPETSTHTASVWLLDARGRIRTKYSAGVPFEPGDLAHDFRVLLDESQTSNQRSPR